MNEAAMTFKKKLLLLLLLFVSHKKTSKFQNETWHRAMIAKQYQQKHSGYNVDPKKLKAYRWGHNYKTNYTKKKTIWVGISVTSN